MLKRETCDRADEISLDRNLFLHKANECYYDVREYHSHVIGDPLSVGGDDIIVRLSSEPCDLAVARLPASDGGIQLKLSG